MANVEVHIKGADALAKKFAEFSGKAEDRIKRLINRASINTQRKAKRLVKVDTGTLRSRINIVIYDDGLAADIHADTDYASHVEHGTTHNKMPPPKALDRWAKRHGIPSGYIVARAILAKGGLKPHPFLIPPFREEVDKLRKDVRIEIRNLVKQKGGAK